MFQRLNNATELVQWPLMYTMIHHTIGYQIFLWIQYNKTAPIVFKIYVTLFERTFLTEKLLQLKEIRHWQREHNTRQVDAADAIWHIIYIS